MEKEPVSALQVGDQLLGKFAVERVLGQGGMGIVVQASHMVLGHKVAIKMLLPEACDHPVSVERFLREARAAVQIQSEHVARVSDVGSLPSGLPYMIMEYLEGRDLAEELRVRSTLPVEEATRYVMQALEAIAEAHSLNIVHRDLKPANVFLARRKDGSTTVKVLDFGISKALEAGEVNLTQTSSMMGSPLYMA
ncbi:MAG TPA: serine/threonine-protein kinase, partial [Polyangiaceae bacterium]|nr:serine/threonine-protein kinase [Polyangiaceae bacterium]